MPRLVHGRLLSVMRKQKQADSTHHCTPRPCSIGSLWWFRSSSLISSALSSTGTPLITSFLFDVNLWRSKPPLLHISLTPLMRSMASPTDGTDFKPLSTKKSFRRNSAGAEPSSFSLSSAVVFRGCWWRCCAKWMDSQSVFLRLSWSFVILPPEENEACPCSLPLPWPDRT